MDSQNYNRTNKIISYARTGLILGATVLFFRGCYNNSHSKAEHLALNKRQTLYELANAAGELKYFAMRLKKIEPELSEKANISYEKIDILETILQAKTDSLSNTPEIQSSETKEEANLWNFGKYVMGLIGIGLTTIYARDKVYKRMYSKDKISKNNKSIVCEPIK